MSTQKIKWKVSDVPTGRYRSFEVRGWHYADYDNDDPCAYIRSKSEYIPANVKIGKHAPLVVFVVKYNRYRSEDGAFSWDKLGRYKTLAEAKEAVQKYVDTMSEEEIQIRLM